MNPSAELRPRPCPVCGSNDDSDVFAEASFAPEELDQFAFSSRKIPEYGHFRLVSCPDCDLLYASPIPSPETLAMSYGQAPFDAPEESFYAARTYASFLCGLLGTLPDLSGALDVGTGDGAFLEELLSLGFSGVAGVEPSAASLAAAKEGARRLIRRGIFDPVDFRAGSLSLLTCFQALEHLHDPKRFCAAAHGLLKEGGAAFFVCHDRRALSARVLGMKSPIIDVEHLQLFSFRSVKRLLEETGFSDIRISPISNRYPLHYWLKLLPLPNWIKRRAVSILKRIGPGRWPISVAAGNMAVVGYKEKNAVEKRSY
ncbi:MAG: class I SAM-dependent methyltransferase [Elusimicrobiota bacterium]